MRLLDTRTGPGGTSHNLEFDDRDLQADLIDVLRGRTAAAFCFQPIADLRLGRVAGYEALVRLPTRALLAPDLCLQAAARFGIGEELEALLAASALKARRILPAGTFLSINVSPAFLCSASWIRMVSSQTDLSGVVFEITEAECIEDYHFVRERMAGIFARGGMVAIDDAGAGYASLKHILELKPNFIKLDRSLVQNCGADRAKSTMIEVLGTAADRMDAWVITEGVETADEVSELVRLGVPLAQGFLFGRPERLMCDLSTESQALLRSIKMNGAKSGNLLLYIESCPVSRTREEAARLLSPELSLVCVVDAWGRPAELFEHHPLHGGRSLPGIMRCHQSSDQQETLQRALTRLPETRFDPILVTDGEGRLCGALRIERLIQAVLDACVSPTGSA